MTEINETWEFFRDADGYWKWKRLDEEGNTLDTSKNTFENNADCIADINSIYAGDFV